MDATTCRDCGGPKRIMADSTGRTVECPRCRRWRKSLLAWIGWSLLGLALFLGGAVAAAVQLRHSDLHHTLFGPDALPWASGFFFVAVAAGPAGLALILHHRRTRPPDRRWSPANEPVPYLPRRAV